MDEHMAAPVLQSDDAFGVLVAGRRLRW